jgi:hypothetical protein
VSYTECCYAECHYGECRYVECHYAECRYVECRYAECCYAECRYADCRGAVTTASALSHSINTGTKKGQGVVLKTYQSDQYLNSQLVELQIFKGFAREY